MKTAKKVLTLFLAVCLLMCLAVEIFAASSAKGNVNTVSFTVVTGKKDSTLTVKPSSGKITATEWKNPIKGTTKTVTKSGIYGEYTVSVSGLGSKTMSKKNVTFNLKSNSTYYVTVSYKGMGSFPNTYWNAKWKTNPSWKATVNNSAKIK